MNRGERRKHKYDLCLLRQIAELAIAKAFREQGSPISASFIEYHAQRYVEECSPAPFYRLANRRPLVKISPRQYGDLSRHPRILITPSPVKWAIELGSIVHEERSCSCCSSMGLTDAEKMELLKGTHEYVEKDLGGEERE